MAQTPTVAEKYQGWTNHATWCVSLHLSNTREWADTTARLAQECIQGAPKSPEVRDHIWTVDEAERFNLADAAKDYAESILFPPESDETPSDADNFRADMLRGYFDDVDWADIARSWLASARE